MKDFVNSKVVRGAAWTLGGLGVVADMVSQTGFREMLPDVIEQSAGNMGIPFLATIVLAVIGGKLDEITNNQNKWKIVALAFMLGVLVGVEGQFLNNIKLLVENSSDLGAGLIAMGLGYIASSSIYK